jgi:hypothetical protein
LGQLDMARICLYTGRAVVRGSLVAEMEVREIDLIAGNELLMMRVRDVRRGSDIEDKDICADPPGAFISIYWRAGASGVWAGRATFVRRVASDVGWWILLRSVCVLR